MSSELTLLGVDPGLSHLGYALLGIKDCQKISVLDLGVFKTEKSDKKRKVLASDDNFRRACEMARCLNSIIAPDRKIYAVCAESKSFPRNASSAAKISMIWGILACICENLKIPMVQASPKEVKKAACCCASASKDEVIEAMLSRFGGNIVQFLESKNIPRGQWEHPFDALAAITACLDSEVVKALRRVAECGVSTGS